MKRNKARLHYLLQAYMADALKDDELQELKACVLEEDDDLYKVVDELWLEIDTEKPIWIASNLVYQKILNDPRVLEDTRSARLKPSAKMNRPFHWQRIAGIAALLCVAIGLLYYKQSNNRKGQAIDYLAQQDISLNTISPGGNKAILTLTGGRVINLNEREVGSLAEETGVRIIKTEDGQVFYETTGDDVESSEMMYNTISTPKGGEYQLVLPDGTKVWLNASSSLRYPTRFKGNIREVELTGEAYFEVSRQPMVVTPFIVKSATQTVEVLGTHFNINAYDSAVKTTLLEGGVKVDLNSGDPVAQAYRILKPNQQSTTQIGSNTIKVLAVDPANAVAWKNGYFAFEDDTITNVMKVIARWYDIDVEYEGDMSGKIFGGTISRFETFEKLLQTIELVGTVRFRIEGRRVIVMT